jgi:proteasome lid subunit RPN8/RPN11
MQVELQARTMSALRRHAASAFPHEACGLLARGRDGTQRYVAMTNTDTSRSGFAMDPVEFARRERELREAGLALFGFFHSHPQGPATPSPADAAAAWPRHVQLILGRDGKLSAWYRDRCESDLRQVAISS